MTNLNELFAADVARARLELDEARQLHRDAQGKAGALAGRIQQADQRRQAITTARLAGQVDGAEAAEYAALAGDLETLRQMLVDAQAEADRLKPDVQEHNLQQADDVWNRHIKTQTHAASAAQTCELEKLLMASLVATAEAGKACGLTMLSAAYQFSPALRSALQYGVLPPKEQTS